MLQNSNTDQQDNHNDEWETRSVVISSAKRRETGHRRGIILNMYDSVASNDETESLSLPMPLSLPLSALKSIQINATKRKSVSVVEKLIKTERIWYLPNLSKESIGRLLTNKPSGVRILRVTF